MLFTQTFIRQVRQDSNDFASPEAILDGSPEFDLKQVAVELKKDVALLSGQLQEVLKFLGKNIVFADAKPRVR